MSGTHFFPTVTWAVPPSHLLFLALYHSMLMGTQGHFTYFIKSFVCHRWCGCVNPIHGLICLQPTLLPLIPRPGCPLGPFGPSRPRSPCQTKEVSSAQFLWNTNLSFSAIQMHLLHCTYCFFVYWKCLLKDFRLIIIECNPSVSLNCRFSRVAQFVWWQVELIRSKLKLIQDLFILDLF